MSDPNEGHRCCCVLELWDGDRSQCPEAGLPADVPFCAECEDRHATGRLPMGVVGITEVLPEGTRA